MSEQRHIIKRQILELTVGNKEDSQRLHAELSRIYRQRIVPLIDRYCTELSEPDLVQRIDLLELDLGQLDPDRLEEDMVARVGAQLRDKLAEQISRQSHPPDSSDPSRKTQSQLELFSLFAQTGSLPWWADLSQPKLLESNLRYLMHHAPAALRRLLVQFAKQKAPLHRIIHHYDAASLSALTSLLIPSLQEDLTRFSRELIAVLASTEALAGRQQAKLKRIVWYALMQTAAIGNARYTRSLPFYREILIRIAAELNVPYRVLLSVLHQVIQGGKEPFHSRLPATITALYDELADANAIVISLQQLEADPADSQTLERIITLLEPMLEQRNLPARLIKEWLGKLRKTGVDARPTDVSSVLAQAIQELTQTDAIPQSPVQESPVDISFSDADEFYIGNAGLVILWPFLDRFFEHLGLLQEKRFKDATAVHRATGLLQYLAAEDPAPPEYLLALNKLLCGMELTAVLDFGPPVSEAEAEECSALLGAVIAHAPILNNMSAAGFRNTFLRRRGRLGARDGAWLLQAERETYDVVLDRFPWTISWVKLPWMTAPLRVEW